MITEIMDGYLDCLLPYLHDININTTDKNKHGTAIEYNTYTV